jgi:16S rRNA C967 or C1407 C5-methylase (RsmB/RsmF family)
MRHVLKYGKRKRDWSEEETNKIINSQKTILLNSFKLVKLGGIGEKKKKF